ncbi:hypothetical protein Tco_1208323 [Tanacetum coccineum]
MSDSEHSTVTYTSVSEDDPDMGSPGVEGPIFQDPPSPDYVPGPEEPEQAPPSPIYVPFVPEPVYPEFLPVDDESDPEEDPEEDDEEDPADYPADRGDDRDDEESSDDDDDAEEEEHLAPADPAAVAYSADQDPYLAYRVTARMSIRPQAPAPFLSEEVAERLLALPTPPPSPLSPYSSPLPQIPSPPLPIPSQPPNSPTYVEGSLGSRAAGIRQRDALPTISFAIILRCLRFGLPLRVRGRVVTPWSLIRVGGITTSRNRPFHRRTALLMEEEARLSRAAWAQSMDACDQVHSEGISLRTTVMAQQSEITELQAADRRRQSVISDLLKADYRRQRQLVEALKIVKSLK